MVRKTTWSTAFCYGGLMFARLERKGFWRGTDYLERPLFLAARARQAWLDRKCPCAEQQKLLPTLLEAASGTRFGRHYNFTELARSGNACFTRFSQEIPIRGYDAFRLEWFERFSEGYQLDNVTWPGAVRWFCETSGTTAGSKRIPFTDAMFRMNRRAALDMLSWYAATPGKAQALSGRILYMAGSTSLTNLDAGIASGDMSAITLVHRPAWLAGRVLPQEPLSSSPWQQRLEGMASLLIHDQQIRVISGVPPWILLLLHEVEKQSGRPCREVLSHLRLIIHGGTSMTPYRSDFQRMLPGDGVDYLELLPSSESFMGYQRFGDCAMRLAPWYGTFFEFAPADQIGSDGVLPPHARTVPLWGVSPGIRYAMVLTTCSGLWRYHIGDTIQFLDTSAYRFVFTGRTRSLETFEEKVTQLEVEQAIARLEREFQLTISEYMVGPSVEERRHIWFLSADGPLPDDKATSACLDRELQEQNDDYCTFRRQERIHEPHIIFVPTEKLYAWSHHVRGKLGGQSKIPRIDPDGGSFVESLQAFLAA